MALQAAIEDYHALLSDDLAGETQEQLTAQLERRGLFFGDRPLCSVLRPRFLTPGQYSFLKARCALVLRAFNKAYRAGMEDPGFRRQFRLMEWEEELIRHDPGFDASSPVSRLDAFFVTDRGGLRFTEYNAETPAAAAYNDLLAAVFFGLPVMREFLRQYEVRSQPSRHNVLHALVRSYHQWLGRREAPRIAIIDWRDVPTYSEFVISADYFRAQGLECVIADPREVEYRNGRLVVGDFEIDLIYKRVLISELIERGGLDQPIVRAVLDRAVCMVNSFRCKLLHKKASLAVLGDERNAHLFDRDELEAVHAHIPWTRVVEPRKTRFGDHDVDLLPFIDRHREQLVLKPNDEYGGKGIVLGWEVDDATWTDAIRQALEHPSIVQERIVLPEEPFPSYFEGRVHFEDRIIDTAPFGFYGEYIDGCLTRLSTETLVNVTTGGGSSLATFVVEPRH